MFYVDGLVDICLLILNPSARIRFAPAWAMGTPYTLSMPGGVPLATCTLPVGMFYLLTYLL